jgi:glycosyltransferase involved in cell wall biosynthesis
LPGAGVDVRALAAPRFDPWRFDRRVVWDQVLLPLLAARSGAQVLHAASGTLPVATTLPVVVTVHDMAWQRVQTHVRAYARAYFGTLMRARYRRAAAVIADSEFSAGECRTLTGRADVDVVYPGVDERFAGVVRAPSASPFVLAVGTIERRKQLVRAVETIAAIPGLRLVAVGPFTPYADEVRARAAELGVTERVALRGYVTRAELDALYATATLALVPSQYEGFGYALAEALCVGLPVIAARSSSLIEVAAGDAELVDPADGAGWIDATRALLAAREASEARAAAARDHAVARFAWSTAARACAAIYARVLARS